MALPLGEAGLREIQNESAVLSAMQSNIGEQTGLYIFLGPGVGKNAMGDIDALAVPSGGHAKVFGYHRSLSKRFPFAICYRVETDVVHIRASLDCRRNSSWIRRRVRGR